MFKGKETSNLLFDFKRAGRHSITSFFVFFPFLAVWLDSDNNVLEKKIVQPFKLSVRPKEKFSRLVEIPINDSNSKLLNFLDDRRKV